MRVALHSVIRDGHEALYEADHEFIPDDLTETFARVGIHDWSIWRSGRNLFHLVECDDFSAAMTALETDPANLRWQKFIGRHVEYFVTTADGDTGMTLPHVWDLSSQVAAATQRTEDNSPDDGHGQ
jgi:L-rhamnose mutarotase